MNSSVEAAEAFVQSMLTDPVFGGKMDAKVILQIGKQKGLTKADIKEARKRLNVESVEAEEGRWIWRWPWDVGKRH